MKTLLTLIFTGLIVNAVYTQHLMFYKQPELALTDYQKLNLKNIIKDTKTFQLKGDVKSVTIKLKDRNIDSLTFKEEKINNIKSYFETYKFEFTPDNKLHLYEQKVEQEYEENQRQNPLVFSKETTYYFDDKNKTVIKIKDSHIGRSGELITEKNVDSKGFLIHEKVYQINSNGKQMYHIKNYKWNEQRNTLTGDYNYYYPVKEEKEELSFERESYKRPLYKDTTIREGDLIEGKSITFDQQGNIVSIKNFEEDLRALPPNNYIFTYTYNEDNELIEILKKGSTSTGFLRDEKTTFQYDNYDEYGNWREVTISTTDDTGKYRILKYKREIVYY